MKTGYVFSSLLFSPSIFPRQKTHFFLAHTFSCFFSLFNKQKRYLSDRDTNNYQCNALRGDAFASVAWSKVVVGDVLKVYNGISLFLFFSFFFPVQHSFLQYLGWSFFFFFRWKNPSWYGFAQFLWDSRSLLCWNCQLGWVFLWYFNFTCYFSSNFCVIVKPTWSCTKPFRKLLYIILSLSYQLSEMVSKLYFNTVVHIWLIILLALVECERPNNRLYTFSGFMEIKGEKKSLAAKQVLLRVRVFIIISFFS